MSMLTSASATARKTRAAYPGMSGIPDDGHLGLAAVVCDSGQKGAFHGCVLDRSDDDGAGFVRIRRPDVHRNVVAASVFHAAQHQYLGAAGGHLEHLLERDGVELPGVVHDPRVRAEDAVHVGVDLADVGAQRRGQRDRRGVRAAAAQRGDVPRVLADTLEAGDQHDATLVERGLQPSRRDLDDLRVAVGAGGDHAGLRAGERAGLRAQRFDCHGHQRVGDALAGGQQHVEFARRRDGAHLLGQVQQVIGGVAHRRDHHDDVVALLFGLHDAFGDPADPVGIGHRGSAVLLHDERHCCFPPFPFVGPFRPCPAESPPSLEI